MSSIDIVAWVAFVVIAVAIMVLALELAALPGKIAGQRNHPWAEAVKLAGWLGLFMGGVFWPLALIWAYVDAPAAARKEPAP
ncbi:MAG: DUF3302 domain-containing protein [Methylobacterium sp.]|jgi:hypothetical protein